MHQDKTAQVYIAAGIMQKIYKNDKSSFHSIYEPWLDDQDKAYEFCTIL